MNRKACELRAAPAGVAADSPVALQDVYEFHSVASLLFSVFRDIGREFEYDYTAWVVISAFLVASAADSLRDAAARGAIEALAPGVLSVQSISDMTGIPRETVRRKCLGLEQRGLMHRLPNGLYRCDTISELLDRVAGRFIFAAPRAANPIEAAA